MNLRTSFGNQLLKVNVFDFEQAICLNSYILLFFLENNHFVDHQLYIIVENFKLMIFASTHNAAHNFKLCTNHQKLSVGPKSDSGLQFVDRCFKDHI